MENLNSPESRRAFIQKAGSICGLALVSGTAIALTGCATLPVVKTASDGKTLKVPLSAFAKSSSVLVRNKDQEYDILLIKKTDGYTALQMKCTHRDTALNSSATSIHCTDHGSRFDLEGKVLEGPAKKPLKTYLVAATETEAIISLT